MFYRLAFQKKFLLVLCYMNGNVVQQISGMPRSIDLNAGYCVVSTGPSYSKQLFFRSAWCHAANAVGGKQCNLPVRLFWKNWVFFRNDFELTNPNAVSTLFTVKCFIFKLIPFFLTRNSPVAMVRPYSLHFCPCLG